MAIWATIAASSSRTKSPLSLPLSSLWLSSITTSKQATAGPLDKAARVAARGVKPGCPAASDRGLETTIAKFEDRGARAEVRRDLEDIGWVLPEECALGHEVGVDVGAAEAVDRLLRVSHQKQTARPQPASRPRLALISLSPHKSQRISACKGSVS